MKSLTIDSKPWDTIYNWRGNIHPDPSKKVVELVPRLISESVEIILDVGCGTGRHCEFFASQGFKVLGIDLSHNAINLAQSKKLGKTVMYCVGTTDNLPICDSTVDFILSNHSLEYGTWEVIEETVKEFDRVLKPGGLLFLRAVSNQHEFKNADSNDVHGFSHIGYVMKHGLPVHFFSQNELIQLFENFDIESIKHVSHSLDHKKISVPLKEWVMLAKKKYDE